MNKKINNNFTSIDSCFQYFTQDIQDLKSKSWLFDSLFLHILQANNGDGKFKESQIIEYLNQYFNIKRCKLIF